MKFLGIITLTTVVVGILASREELTHATRTFTGKFYKELITIKPNDSVIFSPVMIQTLMGVVMSASQNDNNPIIQETRPVLDLPWNKDRRENAFKELLDDLYKADNGFKIFHATTMYLSPRYVISLWYRHSVRSYYKADIKFMDFRHKAGTSQSINQWVASKTNNKIIDFTDHYNIRQNMENLLISTLYLRGKWDRSFRQENNIWNNFTGPYGARQVEMMTNNKCYNYYEDNDAQYLKLEMMRDGGGADMIFVLPKQEGLTNLEYNIQNVFKPVPFSRVVVNVTLPKFTLSNDINLRPVLQTMGIRKLFERGTELPGLQYHDNPLFTKITDVLQKAFIEVDEWGISGSRRCIYDICPDECSDLNKTFTADQPFIFYITVDEAVVYAGRVMQV